MAQSMRTAATGTECRAFSSGRRAAAPRAAAPARRVQQQQQQQCMRAAAPAPMVAARRPTLVQAVASQQSSAQQQQASGEKVWWALVANAEFYCAEVQNESVAEQLREKARYFREQGKEQDFFLVPNPKWLDAKYPAQGKQVRRPCLALVSTDTTWITFMKLRLDRVLKIELVGLTTEEVLEAGEALPEFKRPEIKTSPYPWYSAGWWEKFYPPSSQ